MCVYMYVCVCIYVCTCMYECMYACIGLAYMSVHIDGCRQVGLFHAMWIKHYFRPSTA